MPTAAYRPPRRSATSRAVAILASASLSCATVRVPASGIPGSVRIRGDAAEPQVELWVESGRDVTPAEAARAAAEARSALERALAGRAMGDGSQLLVVRAQGVSRTGSRKTDQAAAMAGLAVAAVAFVALAVVVLVAATKAGGGGRSPAIGAAPGPRAPAPVPRPPPVAGAHPVVPPPARPAPGQGGGGIGFALGANVQVGGPSAEAPPTAQWSDSVEAGSTPAPAEPPAVAPPPPPERGWPEEIALAPPPPLDLGKRGFFEGDSSRLEITVVDRATMSPRRVKVVESKDDPRDAEAMRALVDRALSDPGGWEELPLAPAAPPAHPL